MVDQTNTPESLFRMARTALSNMFKPEHERNSTAPRMGEVFNEFRSRAGAVLEPREATERPPVVREPEPQRAKAMGDVVKETAADVVRGRGPVDWVAGKTPLASTAVGATGTLLGFNMVTKVVSGGTLGKKEAIQAGLGLLIGGAGLAVTAGAAKGWVQRIGQAGAQLQQSYAQKVTTPAPETSGRTL